MALHEAGKHHVVNFNIPLNAVGFGEQNAGLGGSRRRRFGDPHIGYPLHKPGEGVGLVAVDDEGKAQSNFPVFVIQPNDFDQHGAKSGCFGCGAEPQPRAEQEATSFRVPELHILPQGASNLSDAGVGAAFVNVVELHQSDQTGIPVGKALFKAGVGN